MLRRGALIKIYRKDAKLMVIEIFRKDIKFIIGIYKTILFFESWMVFT